MSTIRNILLILLITVFAFSAKAQVVFYHVDSSEMVQSRLVGTLASSTSPPVRIVVLSGDGAKFARVGVPLEIAISPYKDSGLYFNWELDSVSAVIGDTLVIAKRKLSNDKQLTWLGGSLVRVVNNNGVIIKQLQRAVAGLGVQLPDTTGQTGNYLQVAHSGLLWAAVAGGGAVTSFNTRTGAVIPSSGDYSFSQIGGFATVAQGGTGLTGIASGKLLYASSTNVFAPLSIGTGLSISGGILSASLSGFTTSDIAEGSNLYYTDARARAAISATAPIQYNSTTGVISETQATNLSAGYLSSADWVTFNSKQNALTLPLPIANGGTGAITANKALKNLLPDSAGHSGQAFGPLRGGGWGYQAIDSSTSPGTVTSIDMTVPSFLAVSGNPITSSGTLAVTLTNEDSAKVLIGPVSGSATTPTFRLLQATDIPAIAATSLTGVLPVVNGGTGQSSFTDGQLMIGNTSGNTLTKSTLTGTANEVIVTNGHGSITLSTPQPIATTSDVTFDSVKLAIPLALANGGTGRTSLTANGILFGGTDAAGVTSALANATLITSGAGVPSLSQTLPSAVQGNITSLGTIGSGTWNGTAITVPYGGTGLSTITAHKVLVGAGTSNVALVGVGATNTVLHGNTGADPSFSAVSLTADVSGVLPIANGGTNSSSALTGSAIMTSDGTSIVQGPAGTATTLLHGNAAGAPTYGAVALAADVSGALPIANGGTGQTTRAAAFNALVPDSTGKSGDFLKNKPGGGYDWISIGGLDTDAILRYPSTDLQNTITTTDTTLTPLTLQHATSSTGHYLQINNGVSNVGYWDVNGPSGKSLFSVNGIIQTTNGNINAGVGYGFSGDFATFAPSATGASPLTLQRDTGSVRPLINFNANDGSRVAFVDWEGDAHFPNYFQVAPGISAAGLATWDGSGSMYTIGLTNGQLAIGNTGTVPTAATITPGTGINVTNGAGSITINNTGVTSVNVSGGTTGLTASGGPITTTGTITLAGTLAVANGGTGQTTIAAARKAILPDSTGNAGEFLQVVPGGGYDWAAIAGSGTVTSVSGSGGSTGLTLSGGPITTSGTLTLGGTLGVPNGGTGLTTLTNHAIQIGAGVSTPTQLGLGTTTTVLHGNASGDPSFGSIVNADITNSTIDLAAKVTGVLPVANGGSGAATLTNHGVLLGAGTSAINPLAVASSNTVLHGNTGADPSFSAVSLTADVTGIAPIANGGTNSSTALSGNSIMISNGTSVIQGAKGMTTTLLHGNASGDPSYSKVDLGADVGGTLPMVGGGTGFSSYSPGDMLYSDGFNLLKLTVGGANTVIHGGSIPAYSAIDLTADVTGVLTKTNGGTGLSGYSTGDILYANGSGNLTRLGIGSYGGVLINSTTGLPAWVAPGTNGYVLTSHGISSDPDWQPASTGTVTSVSGSGGSTGLTLTGGAITTSGTLTLGGTLVVANGGTGATSLTAHGIVVGNGTSAVNVTSVGATNTVLHGNTGADPTYGTVDITADITGILPIANGGTNGATQAAALKNLTPDTTGNSGKFLGVTAGGGIGWNAASAGVTTFSAGTTGFTPSSATAGVVTLAGTLAVANGGTGQTTYTNGQLLIGNTTGNTLTKTTLTGTSNQLTVTNSTGSITLSVPTLQFYHATSNTFVGVATGRSALTGTENTDVGNASMTAITTGTNNVSVGNGNLTNLTTGSINVAIGSDVGGNLVTGSNNTLINVAGGSLSNRAQDNIMIGVGGGGTDTSSYNVIIGDYAMSNSSGQGYNTFVGYNIAGNNPAGKGNIFLGALTGTNGVTSATTGVFIAGGQSYPITDVYFGNGPLGLSAVGTSYTVHGSGGNGTNSAGGNVTLTGGIGTGNSASGSVIFQSAKATPSSTTPQTLIEIGRFDTTGLRLPLGKGLTITTGANAKMGTAVLSSGTVTVSTTAVTVNSLIFLTDENAGVNIGSPSVGTVTAGTGFVINSTNVLDTSTIAWMIVEKQ